MKVIVIFLLLSIWFVYSDALINIQMHPDDLDRVSEFFELIMINNYQRIPVRSKMISFVMKSLYSTSKWIGVMLLLTTSTLLSTKLEPYVIQTNSIQLPDTNAIAKNCPLNFVMQSPAASPQQHRESLVPSLCNDILNNSTLKDFGCHKNVCWRSCFVLEESETEKPWCFSSPKVKDRKYFPCHSPADCSPNWECLETCHF